MHERASNDPDTEIWGRGYAMQRMYVLEELDKALDDPSAKPSDGLIAGAVKYYECDEMNAIAKQLGLRPDTIPEKIFEYLS